MLKARLLVVAAALAAALPLIAAPAAAAAPSTDHTPSAVRPANRGTIHGCPYGALCIYHNEGFTGEMIPLSKCGLNDRKQIRWRNVGSWVNNQTDEKKVGVFRDYFGAVWSRTGKPYDEEKHQNWAYIWSAQPC